MKTDHFAVSNIKFLLGIEVDAYQVFGTGPCVFSLHANFVFKDSLLKSIGLEFAFNMFAIGMAMIFILTYLKTP
jgi:hypothetical protein